MSFIPQELIRRKRDGGELSDEELAFLVAGIADGGLSDGQVAAFAMAVFFRDLSDAERVAMTGAMTRSGTVLEWDVGPVVDKHSTGGVGDKVSLILAPILAACGGWVPMISGRGLGHTGGTLDKLDSIPGYRTAPDLALLRSVVADAGCAIIGQTPELAPADRRFYALRDATATVESIPLIVGSILSKKLAAGLDALVMDVKAGSGAFMPSREKSAELARAIVAVARGNGLACEALLTDMDQVLGRTAGNAVEVRESLGVLMHPRTAEPRLVEVTLALAATLLRLAGLFPDDAAARAAAGQALASGAAAERFARMCAALGGPADLLDDPDRHLPRAPHVLEVVPGRPRAGRLGGGARRRRRGAGAGGRPAARGRGDRPRRRARRRGRAGRGGRSRRAPARGRARARRRGAERAAARLRAAFAVGDAPAAIPPLVEAVA